MVSVFKDHANGGEGLKLEFRKLMYRRSHIALVFSAKTLKTFGGWDASLLTLLKGIELFLF